MTAGARLTVAGTTWEFDELGMCQGGVIMFGQGEDDAGARLAFKLLQAGDENHPTDAAISVEDGDVVWRTATRYEVEEHTARHPNIGEAVVTDVEPDGLTWRASARLLEGAAVSGVADDGDLSLAAATFEVTCAN